MENLLKKAAAGDHQAIMELIEQDEEVLYPIAYTYLKNEQDALDAMQEMTYKALKKMHTIKQPEFGRTWLVRVLINCCNDMLKKRIQTVEIEETSLSEYQSSSKLTYAHRTTACLREIFPTAEKQ